MIFKEVIIKMNKLTIEVDDALFNNALKVFESEGLNMEEAINIFLTESVKYGGFPFETNNNKDTSYPEGYFDLFGQIKDDVDIPLDPSIEKEDFKI